jgi:Domain of unknown function (DUF4331)
MNAEKSFEKFRRSLITLGMGLMAASFTPSAFAADHKDSPDSDDGNLDITDLYVFSKADAMVFVMNVSPFLTPGSATTAAAFNPNGLYQFKLDKERDGIEDAVIQISFSGTGTSQKAMVRGPEAPTKKGPMENIPLATDAAVGGFNTVFTGNGLKVFAGPRDDSFFLHLLGDSSLTSVLNGVYTAALKTAVGSASEQTLAFANPGKDDFKGANVLSIVVEVPKSVLAGKLGIAEDGAFYTWATTSKKN